MMLFPYDVEGELAINKSVVEVPQTRSIVLIGPKRSREYSAAASRKNRKKNKELELLLIQRNSELEKENVLLAQKISKLHSEFAFLSSFEQQDYSSANEILANTNSSLKSQLLQFRLLTAKLKTAWNDLENYSQTSDCVSVIRDNMFLLFTKLSEAKKILTRFPKLYVNEAACSLDSYIDHSLGKHFFREVNRITYVTDEASFMREYKLANVSNLKKQAVLGFDGSETWMQCDMFGIPIKRKDLDKLWRDIDILDTCFTAMFQLYKELKEDDPCPAYFFETFCSKSTLPAVPRTEPCFKKSSPRFIKFKTPTEDQNKMFFSAVDTPEKSSTSLFVQAEIENEGTKIESIQGAKRCFRGMVVRDGIDPDTSDVTLIFAAQLLGSIDPSSSSGYSRAPTLDGCGEKIIARLEALIKCTLAIYRTTNH